MEVLQIAGVGIFFVMFWIGCVLQKLVEAVRGEVSFYEKVSTYQEERDGIIGN